MTTRRIDTDAVIDRIRLKEQGSDPASPASGYEYLFVKSGGVYAKNSAGTVTGPLTDHAALSIGAGGLSAKLSLADRQVLTLGAINHSDLSSIGTDDHHAKSHVHLSDGSGTVAHSSLSGIGTDDHHAKVHTHASDAQGGAVPYSSIGPVIGAVTGDPTGFVSPQLVVINYDPTARTVTLTGTVTSYYKGTLVTAMISGWVSDAHPATTGHGYYLSYDGATFSWATDTPWSLDKMQIAYVWYGATNKFALRECHGIMDWRAHEIFHDTIGAFKESGGTTTWPAPGTFPTATTAALRRPDVVETEMADEDLKTTLPALTSKAYTQCYLSGTGTLNYVLSASDIIPLNGNTPYWNEYTGGAWQQTPMTANTYTCVWLVGVPVTASAVSQAYRYLWFQGQTSGSLVSQQARQPADVNLGTLHSEATEFVFLQKIIVNYQSAGGGNWVVQEVTTYSGSHFSQTGIAAGTYLSTVTSDATLSGAGTLASPLSVVVQNLLSAAHGDTTAAAVVRGDIITGQGATPKWTRLAKGTQYQILTGGANEPAWGALALDQATAISGILPASAGGTGVNNSTRTLTISTNAGTLAFSAASKTLTIPDTGTVAYRDLANTFNGTQTISNTTNIVDFKIYNNAAKGEFPTNVTAPVTNTFQISLGKNTGATYEFADLVNASGTYRLGKESLYGGTDNQSIQFIRSTDNTSSWGMIESVYLKGLAFGTYDTRPIAFFPNRTHAMTLLAGGKLGILTDTPNVTLDVAGTIRATGYVAPSSGAGINIFYSSGCGYFVPYDSTNSQYKAFRLEGNPLHLNADSGYNVLVGTTTDAARLTVNGAIAIADGMTAPSATSGFAKIYVDTADGDLKVIFGDGTVKTIVTDT